MRVLTDVSTRTHDNKYTHLQKRVRRTYENECVHSFLLLLDASKALCVLPHFRLEKNACKCLRVCFLRVSLADSIIICNFVLLSMLLVVRFTVAK